MLEALGGLNRRAAFDGKDNVARALGFHDLDDAFPVQNAFAAGAADGGAADLAALGVGVRDRDVLRVQMDKAAGHPLKPGIDIMAAGVGIAGVEVDADGG